MRDNKLEYLSRPGPEDTPLLNTNPNNVKRRVSFHTHQTAKRLNIATTDQVLAMPCPGDATSVDFKL